MIKSTILCDLDGCLNYYPDTFLRWVGQRYGVYKQDMAGLKEALSPIQYEEAKYEYRTCGVKRSLAVRDGAVEVLRELRALGKKIWISTSRPTFEPVRGDTEYWLSTNGIIHDRLMFLSKEQIKDRIPEIVKGIWFAVEDDSNVAACLAEQLGIPVFLFGDEPDGLRLPCLVTKVRCWYDIKISLNYTSLSYQDGNHVPRPV